MLFSSLWAVGGIRIFGRILAIRIFVIAAFIPIAGAYVTLAALPDPETGHAMKKPRLNDRGEVQGGVRMKKRRLQLYPFVRANAIPLRA